MKSDLINRQAALDALNHELRCGAVIDQCGLEMAYEVIEGLPSAQSEPRWIPCSEKLPEDGTEVFVYLYHNPTPYIAWIVDSRWCTEWYEVDREYEPLAWMPLPKPYRKETKDGRNN